MVSNAKGYRAEWLVRRSMNWLTLQKTYGAKGLAYIAINEDGTVKSSFAKFMTDDEMKALIEAMGGENRRLVIICCR